ncbi:30S ribosomal protein S13 [bacterium]|nr:30S ribosomal protein S13 [bacterium]
MPRIVGVDIPKEKRTEIALTYIFGIGLSSAKKILKTAGINGSVRAKDLTEEEVNRIASILQKDFEVEGDLRRDVSTNIRRLMDIHAYRGLRHMRNLPCRGQRTHTNARTRKGSKKSVTAARVVKTNN